MTSLGNDMTDPSNQNELSKRQQKKLDQVIKRIEASQNAESNSHRKRKQNHDAKADPQARKMIKIQSQISNGKNKDGISSGKQLSEDDSKIHQKVPIRQLKDLHNVYNQKYGISKQAFSDYMVNYTYGQKLKMFQKQTDDWSILQGIAGKKVQCKLSSIDKQITGRINDKFCVEKNEKGRVKELFSKNSRQFFRKVMGQEFEASQ